MKNAGKIVAKNAENAKGVVGAKNAVLVNANKSFTVNFIKQNSAILLVSAGSLEAE